MIEKTVRKHAQPLVADAVAEAEKRMKEAMTTYVQEVVQPLEERLAAAEQKCEIALQQWHSLTTVAVQRAAKRAKIDSEKPS